MLRRRLVYVILGLAISDLLLTDSLLRHVVAQTAGTPITSSGLNTQISGPIQTSNGVNQFNITGGTRPGSGPNLFHSFGEFGVPTNNLANFLNDTTLPTSNILGRVTGGNPSNIFGTIQTTGFGSANLFLMNPAGILFGPTASLNVGGSVSFTTADYLRLTDGARFNAIPGPQDASISSAPVAAFGFLGSNPGAITVQGSQLAVSEGSGISFIGGNIEVTATEMENGTLHPARVSAPGGQINLISSASPGEVVVSNYQPGPNMRLGPITLSQEIVLDVSADAAGLVRIRGGQLIMDKATISADTINANGSSVAIDINLTGDLSISATDAPALTARTTGSGDAGEIRLVSENMMMTGLNEDVLTIIDSHTSGTGRGGNITITTGDLQMIGDPVGLTFPLNSGTTGEGNGGNVSITAKNVTMENVFMVTGDPLLGPEEASGSAGNVDIQAESLSIITGSIEAVTFTGKGGDISVAAQDLSVKDGFISASSFEHQSGTITVSADSAVLDNSSIDSATVALPGGGITVTGGTIELRNGSQLLTSTLGDGNAGPISVTATDHLTLSAPTFFSRPSGLFSTAGISSLTRGDIGGSGDAGSMLITTPRLEVSGGARINTATNTGGRGGDVTINAETISISGQLLRVPAEPVFSLGNRLASGIFTATVGSPTSCAGPCGSGGAISINGNSLTLANGAQIDSGTNNSGRGGDITIKAQNTVSLNGTLRDGSPVGIFSRSVGTVADSGTGGNVTLTAGQSVSLSNGASISASSTGPANAGNIAINAGAQFRSQNASVTTEATQASGGNILIQATDAIQLVNSRLNTSVQGGPTTAGGNITLDPALVTLQNSQVTAQAVQGTGGNINIIAGTFLADPTSVVSASSQFGLSGTVNIQSPVSNLSGSLATLPQRPLQAQNLLRQRCAAQVNGQLSSLVVAGRDALPAEPGGWLMSPLWSMTGDEPTEQAHLATHRVFDPLHQRREYSRRLSDQHDSSSPRGTSDRETGCGS